MTQPVPQAGDYSRHFYSLDALRGLAALGVVLSHWPYFFGYGPHSTPVDLERLPVYPLLKPLYVNGWQAVDLFFCLSGFIFFWLYSKRIAERKISAWQFGVLRFSRLYPLHLATLIFVAAAQWIMLKSFGSFFVYTHNDIYDFILQLFFVWGWGIFEHGAAFNAPIWSVSIEVMLYSIFFALCCQRGNRWWWLIPMACLSIPLAHFGFSAISRGVLSFFIGGLAYYLFHLLWRRGLTRFHVIGLVASTALLWITLTNNMYHYSFYDFYQASGLRERLLIGHKDAIGAMILVLTPQACELVLFPMTVLTLAVCEAYRGTLGKRLAFLGHGSYSIYLLHFPLQLSVMFVALELAVPSTVFYSPWFMLAFYGVLIVLALASFHSFESPAQKLLREKLLPDRIKSLAPA